MRGQEYHRSCIFFSLQYLLSFRRAGEKKGEEKGGLSQPACWVFQSIRSQHSRSEEGRRKGPHHTGGWCLEQLAEIEKRGEEGSLQGSFIPICDPGPGKEKEKKESRRHQGRLHATTPNPLDADGRDVKGRRREERKAIYTSLPCRRHYRTHPHRNLRGKKGRERGRGGAAGAWQAKSSAMVVVEISAAQAASKKREGSRRFPYACPGPGSEKKKGKGRGAALPCYVYSSCIAARRVSTGELKREGGSPDGFVLRVLWSP